MARVIYDLELSYSDILLVEQYNGSHRGLFFDPLYIKVVKDYFSLLKKDKANTLEISNEKYIEKIFSENKNTTQVQYISGLCNPIQLIQEGINNICDAVPEYLSYQERAKELNLTNEEYIKKYLTYKPIF